MTKTNKATDKKPNPIVQAQLDSLSYDKEKLTKEVDVLTTENVKLKRQLKQANDVLETSLAARIKMSIRGKSTYNDADLEGLTIEQLQYIDKTLDKSKPMTDATFKSIRAGGASEQRGPTTVGDLCGKTKDEIREMGGEH